MGIDDIKDAKRYELTDEDWAGIDQLVAEKYDNWEWNYGRSPRYEYNRNDRFACGTIDISLSIAGNRIEGCSIFGDFFGQGDIKDVEDQLIGTRMVKSDLLDCLNNIDLNFYFGKVTAEELVALILS